METFKQVQIEGLERYSVSNKGKVMADTKAGIRILKPQKDAMGYLHVRLFPEEPIFGEYPNGRGKRPKLEKVHRLVATHFLEVPTDESEYWTVNHKDCNKQNNDVENLEWVTHAENIQHSWDYGLRDNGSIEGGKKRRKPIKVIHKDGRVEYFLSQTHTVLGLNVSMGTLQRKLRDYDNGTPDFGRTGFIVERITDIPAGETYISILGIEEKILEYRDKFWSKSKWKDYRKTYLKEYRERKKKNKK